MRRIHWEWWVLSYTGIDRNRNARIAVTLHGDPGKCLSDQTMEIEACALQQRSDDRSTCITAIFISRGLNVKCTPRVNLEATLDELQTSTNRESDILSEIEFRLRRIWRLCPPLRPHISSLTIPAPPSCVFRPIDMKTVVTWGPGKLSRMQGSTESYILSDPRAVSSWTMKSDLFQM